MTRTETIQKLLALGGLTHLEMRDITGWPEDEVKRVVGDLVDRRVVTYRNGNGGGYRQRAYILVGHTVRAA